MYGWTYVSKETRCKMLNDTCKWSIKLNSRNRATYATTTKLSGGYIRGKQWCVHACSSCNDVHCWLHTRNLALFMPLSKPIMSDYWIEIVLRIEYVEYIAESSC